MRIVITGAGDWQCDELAEAIVNRLIARYGPDIVIVHANEPGAQTSFAMAARHLGITAEVRVIDRNQTGHPTIGARNRELYLGGVDLCIAVHRRIASCARTLDCVRQAFQQRIPVYLIEDDRAIPRRLLAGDERLA